MNNFTSETKYILNDIDLKKGDTVMLVSDISSLLISFKKKGKVFDANLFIDNILEKIGTDGTLLVPTYNYDFCKGHTFDYKNTPSMTGSLAFRDKNRSFDNDNCGRRRSLFLRFAQEAGCVF